MDKNWSLGPATTGSMQKPEQPTIMWHSSHDGLMMDVMIDRYNIKKKFNIHHIYGFVSVYLQCV